MRISPPVVFGILIGITVPGLVIGGRELAILSVIGSVGLLVYSFRLAIKAVQDVNRK